MKRCCLIIVTLGSGVLCIGLLIFSWIAAGWLLAPPRKPLESRHREWLAEARSAHGMRIEKSVTASRVPYLMCEPDATASPGERGLLIRRQLRAKSVQLCPFGEIRGTVVLLHGRGGRKEDLLLTAERFCAAGLRCLLPDLPAHGENPVSHLGFGIGKGESAIAREVLESAAAQFHFSTRPAGLWGISMGGAYAIEAAGERPALWNTLVVVSSFDSLTPVMNAKAAHWVGVLAPVLSFGVDEAARWRGGCWLVRVQPVTQAAELHLPVMIVHGTDDELIALDRGKHLFKALPDQQRSRWVEVPGAHHGNVLVTPMPVFSEMAGWFLRWFTDDSTIRTNKGSE